MPTKTYTTYNNHTLTLTFSPEGNCYCPVCGFEGPDLDWRPYDEMGNPSYDICRCGFQYGFHDIGEPPYDSSWNRYREKWLRGEVKESSGPKLSYVQKLEQLKRIGVKIE